MVLQFVNARLSFGSRLTLLAAVLVLPLLLLCGLFVKQGWKDIASTNRELDGAAYLSAAWPLYARAAAGSLASAAARRDFEQAAARFDPEFGTRALSAAFAAAATPDERAERGQALIGSVADRSNLTLDPGLDTFYLADANTVRLPAQADAAADLKNAQAIVGAPLARAARLGSALDRLQANSAAADRSLRKALAADRSGAARRKLAEPVASLEADARALMREASAASSGLPPEALRLETRRQALARRIDQTWRASQAELVRLLKARRLRLLSALWGSLALVGVALAASATIGWIMVRGFAVRARELLRTMRRLIAGDLSVAVPYRDEPGEIGQIASGVAALKLAAVERARLLDQLEDANRTLEDHRSWLQLALEVGRMGAWRRKLPGQDMEISPELAQLAGRPPDAPTRFPEDIEPLLIDPEHLKRFAEENRRLEQGELDPELTEMVLPIRRRDTGEIRWLMLRRELVVDPSRGTRQIVGVAIDITERKHMMDELNHRVKNNLATVLSLAMQTAKSAEDVKTFQKVFTGRIQALSRINELLTRRAWTKVPVRDVLATTLRPYADAGSVQVGGSPEDLCVSARAAVSLSLVVHEMAAGAARAGALAGGDGGTVEVTWSEPDPEHGALEWTERSNRLATSREDLDGGSRLIERLASGDLGGSAELDFRPEGLRATISFALAGATA
jgi:two-component sensor histidine kinase